MTNTKEVLPQHLHSIARFPNLRPSQAKAINAGLLKGNNILIATPTASGKTLIGFLSLAEAIHRGKTGIYLVPLKALASEKSREAQALPFKTILSVGDYDEDDKSLGEADIIVTTPEKLDSVIRHGAAWIQKVGCVVVDEVHLLGDSHRGPTLELLLTVLRSLVPSAQIVALSATVQNSAELAAWLGATLVQDDWRPVELKEAIYENGELYYKK